jgi:hypothetical protein
MEARDEQRGQKKQGGPVVLIAVEQPGTTAELSVAGMVSP